MKTQTTNDNNNIERIIKIYQKHSQAFKLFSENKKLLKL
jgi:hypothetical protein